MTIRQLVGDARVALEQVDAESVQTVITSPPYYGLRDYGTAPLVWGQSCCEHPHEWGDSEVRQFTAPPGTAKQASNQGASAVVGRSALCQHQHNWSLVASDGQSGGHSTRQLTNAGSFFAPQAQAQGTCACGAWLGSLGLEPLPEMFIEHLVEIFRGVRRVLRPDGLLWVNLGDSYAGSGKGPSNSLNRSNPHSHDAGKAMRGLNRLTDTPTEWIPVPKQRIGPQEHTIGHGLVPGLKPKDLMMMPSRLAIALQGDGWWLRSMIPWLKRNCMPESCNDRPTSAIEYWFLFSKSRRYYWNADAIRTASQPAPTAAINRPDWTPRPKDGLARESFRTAERVYHPLGRQRRNSDWFIESWQGLMLDDDGDPMAFVVNPQPFKGSHFATFPPRLIEPMIRAATRPGDTVLDPFGGAGTVGLVADRLGRDAVLIDLKPEYSAMATDRIVGDAPMFVQMEGGASMPPSESVQDKQAALGKRTYSGFNARWDAKERGSA